VRRLFSPAMHFIGVLNRSGGTFRLTDMDSFAARAEAVFAAAGHTIECRIIEGSELIAELERASTEPAADVVIAGGGDGTVSAAAAVSFRTGKPLAVLPAGTMNLFARTLRMPLNLDEALGAIAEGRMYEADIATANGRPFVHQYSVGLHARLVRIREELPYRNRWEKLAASIRAVFAALAKRLQFQVEIVTPRGRERRIASGVTVSNNLLGEDHVPHADVIDGGVLGVYIAKPMTWTQALRFMVLVPIGRWKGHPRVSEREVTEVTLTFPRRKRTARAVIDGELVPLEPRVHLETHPGALRVVAPQALAEFLARERPGPLAAKRGPDALA
jgi:diacylglycerol kinase family enzyme